MKKEKKFLAALKDVFVGAPVEGESGYINLMRIKGRYFEQGVFPRLIEDINEATEPFGPAFREELFDRLYDFFHRYFSESGSIYFRYTPLHERVYEKVYTDDRDVMLFYKTHMLYYVKTDRLFQSMELEADGFRFHFDVSTLEHKRANEKRALLYAFKEKRVDDALVFTVAYTEKGRKTKTDEVLRALRKLGIDLGEETLEKALRLFERQSEVDYFINKDARAFLREQFDLWLYQYVFEPEQASQTLWTESRIRQLQVIKDIAYKIIDFIAQFEDELVRVWNKPKFVLDSHYVITLERVATQGEDLLQRFLAHEGMGRQMQEWRELGMVGDAFGASDVWTTDITGKRLHDRYQYLPLDTRHFPDLEADLVSQIDHLDQQLDGWLIKSENYQALNSILSKQRARVNCVYADPPYNTGSGDEFVYENTFRHSSWLAMVDNRVRLALELVTADGVVCITIDDYEYRNLVTLLEQYPHTRLLGTVVVRSKPQGRATARGFSVNHEYAVFLGSTEAADVGRLPRTGKKAARYRGIDDDGVFDWANFRGTGAHSTRADRPGLFYPVYVDGTQVRIVDMVWDVAGKAWKPTEEPTSNEQVILPIDRDGTDRVWNLGWRRAQNQIHDLKVVGSEIGPQVFRKYRPHQEGSLPGTWWDNPVYSATESGTKLLEDLFGDDRFSYPKSLFAVCDSLLAGNVGTDGVVLDCFAGSGTTAHAVMTLNREACGKRKYILVEVADYFDTVILPRVKKVAFSDRWKDGKAQEGGKGITHFVKYYRLEQYEDVLRRASYADDLPLFIQADPYSQYVFLRDKKMLDNAKTGEKVLTLDTEKEEVQVDLSRLYESIDVAETLSCVTGKWVRRLSAGEVEFEGGEKVSLSNLPWEYVKPLIWW